MKFLKLAVATAFAFAYGNAYAFHSGGVGECEGCHSMHNSFEGSANVTGMAQYQSGPYLLKAQDQSGSCLNCHQAKDTNDGKDHSYHISTAGITAYDSTLPVEWTPGGDFAWLKKTMTFTQRNKPVTVPGERRGHNIIATDFGFAVDSVLKTAPGGSYPATALACSSCHDPHGRYRRDAGGNFATTGLPIFNSGSYTSSADPISGVSAVGAYRLLAGKQYQPKSLAGSFAFSNDPPIALAPSSYNSANTTIAGTADRVAYGTGMSEWCANCHTAMHLDTYTSGTKGLVHPAGSGAKLTAPIAANYVAYVSSGIAGTPPDNGYSALAPFETGNDGTPAGITALRSFQAAPTGATNGNVLCLSCHRAHASGFESMARYFLAGEFMTAADSANGATYGTDVKYGQGLDATQQQAAYNGRAATLFGPYARNYCNKCHAKD